MTAEFQVPASVPYFTLEAREAFDSLTAQQRLYAHHLAWAGWHGTTACAEQLSPQSVPLLKLFFAIFVAHTVPQLRELAVAKGVSEADFEAFVQYAALTYSSMGNYLSFGDSKFIPACPRAAFEAIIGAASGCGSAIGALATPSLIDGVYSLDATEKTLNFNSSNYYGGKVTKEEIALVDEWMATANIEPWNTRIFKRDDDTLELRLAAAVKQEAPPVEFKGRQIVVARGDFAPQMSKVAEALQLALAHAENDHQRGMLRAYIEHFTNGDIDAHKQAQRHWVKDQGPAVESNIGFIENYRDPAGVRAEWEGFVAVVNKQQSLQYQELVRLAPQFIAQLPWGRSFEIDVFLKPDFTSLEVLAFASSGLPAGINIPNYDDVRKTEGFKNVYLANVVAAMSLKEKANHYTDADWELFKRYYHVSYPINVGIHELLGHGTGKLLTEDANGALNFDRALINPIDGQPVSSWYKPGEGWSSVFKGLSNAMEECRAEAVALFLSVDPDLLSIFGVREPAEQFEAVHILWLNMIRAGLIGTEFYNEEKKQWLQAHCRARFAILQALLRAPNSIVTIHEDGDSLTIEVDPHRIRTDGRAVIGELLVRLNVYKATADATRGTAWFEDLTQVDEATSRYRQTVLRLKKPRRQLVQPHTRLTASGDVELLQFEGSAEGAIQAMVARHRDIPLL